MPSPTDGSHQLPIPTDELVVGEVLPPRIPCRPPVAFQGPRHLCVQRSGCGPPGADPANLPPEMPENFSEPSAPVFFWFPGALAPWDRGENISGPLSPVSSPSRPLRGCVSGPSAPALPAPEGRPPPCLTECPRSHRCPRRGRWRPRTPGFHSHPRAREGEMPETSGASQVHLWLSMEVLLRQLRNLERSRPPAAPHCDSICVQ